MNATTPTLIDEGWPADLIQIRCPGVCFYVLREGDALYLIDTGFLCAETCLDAALHDRGWQHLPVRGILLTHGHIDHILNAAHFAQRFSAWIAAPAADAAYYAGELLPGHSRRPISLLEHIGRHWLSFQPFHPDQMLVAGDVLPLWQGLRAVHLPGHTPGHMGYYSEKRGLLFSGDLFASYGRASHFPPASFNADTALQSHSARQALELPLKGVFPHHCNKGSPAEYLSRLRALVFH